MVEPTELAGHPQSSLRSTPFCDGAQIQVSGLKDSEISAVQAVLFWRYRPAEVHGRPVEVYFTIRIDHTFG